MPTPEEIAAAAAAAAVATAQAVGETLPTMLPQNAGAQPVAYTPPVPAPQPAMVRCPDGSLVPAGQACPEKKTNWLPWVIGGLAVAAGIGAAYWITRQKGLLREGAESLAEESTPLKWLPSRDGATAHSAHGTYRVVRIDERHERGGVRYELSLGSKSLGSYAQYTTALAAGEKHHQQRSVG